MIAEAESAETAVELTFRYLSPELHAPELEDKLQAFKAKYFGAGGGYPFSSWKYRHGPIDSGECAVIALTREGEIAGHLGAVVFPAVPGSRLARLALGTEFVVDEKYRGGKHDVIRRLDIKLGERLIAMGAGMMYALPNKYGYIVSKRLYRRVDGPKCEYLSKVFTPALAFPGRFRKAAHALFSSFGKARPALPSGWACSRPDFFEGPDIEAFCREFARRLEFGTFRNAAFLNWRYGGGDGARYENILLTEHGKVAAIAVLRVNPRRCVGALLMECMALNDQGHDALLSVCGHLASQRAAALSVLAVRESQVFPACKRYGFRANADILAGIGRVLAWLPSTVRKYVLAKAENHFPLDGNSTLYFYPGPALSKDFIRGSWYLSLGEKFGF